MKETDPGAPGQEARELFQDYITYYRAGGREGRLWACKQPAVTQKAKQFLASGARQPRRLCLYEKAITGGSSQGLLGQGEDVCPKLVTALEFLELICVNLFLLPWRREIKSLKTFTGNFVYSVRSVLPENIVEMILKRIGYVAITATEFSLVRKINEEEAMQTAFEIFLTRVECETILEMSPGSGHKEEVSTLLQSTQPSRPSECWKDMETPPNQVSKTPGEVETGNLLSSPRDSQNPVDKSKFESPWSGTTEDSCHLKSDLSLPRGTSPTDALTHEQDVVQDLSKCSESDEFLNCYRDIFIGQMPIFPKDLPPSGQRKHQPWGGCRDKGIFVSSKASMSRVASILPPMTSSGPQALTVFTNTSDNSQVPDLWVRPTSAEMADGACLGNTARPTHPESQTTMALPLCDNIPLGDDWSSEDELDDLSSSFSRLHIKTQSTESLEYPVKETSKVNNDQDARIPTHSEVGYRFLDGTSKMHHKSQPPSDLMCGSQESGSSESKKQQLQRAPSSFRHVREPPNITYIPPKSLEINTTISTHHPVDC